MSMPYGNTGGPSKIQADHCLVRRDQWKFLKDIKLLLSEEA